MFYIVYKVTNVINKKIYIGAHKTKNIQDNYMGSGKLLKKAIKKYGIENFKKEILAICDAETNMYEIEKKLVNEEFIDQSDTYNLKIGGSGGFNFINENNLNNINNTGVGGKSYAKKVKEDKNFRKNLSNKNSERLKKLHSEGKFKYNNFSGKKHSSNTKEKIGKANSKNQMGSKNSNFGNCWIYNEELKKSRCIKKNKLEEWIKNGWKKGRKCIMTTRTNG